MSKGDRPRPFSISQREYADRMDAIFGEKPKRERYVPPPLPPELLKEIEEKNAKTK